MSAVAVARAEDRPTATSRPDGSEFLRRLIAQGDESRAERQAEYEQMVRQLEAQVAGADAIVVQARRRLEQVERQLLDPQADRLEVETPTALERATAPQPAGTQRATEARRGEAMKEDRDALEARPGPRVRVRELNDAYRVAVWRRLALERKKAALQKNINELKSREWPPRGDEDRLREGAPGGASRPAPAPVSDLWAVVTASWSIGGVRSATVSVGSDDGVTRGMKFSIYRRNADEFLGYLTVDRLGPHEASGRINGPKVHAIVLGTEGRQVEGP